MRVLVCGGRDFGNREAPQGRCLRPHLEAKADEYNFIFRTLDEMATGWSQSRPAQDGNTLPDITVIAGGARGVDTAAIDWAVTNWCKFYEYPADWKRYGKRAGFIRNTLMLEEGKPDLVVAFPGGAGTAMMVRLAKAKGTPVVEINYNPRS